MKMYKYILLLFSCFVYSQSKTLKVISFFDKNPIEKTLIYSEKKLLGLTNEKGEIIIDDNFEKIIFVKENFQDTEYSINELEKLKWSIELYPLKLIQLDTVVLSPNNENYISILEKIRDSRTKQSRRRFVYYQSKVEFSNNKNIIYSFNNIIFPSEGLKVNDENKIIYKGFTKKDSKNNLCEVFKIDEKEAQLPVQSSVYCSLTDYAITPIFEGKEYNYELEKSEDFYILKFYPKKKNSKLLYDGYFIIDKYDYGIIELKMNLSESKKNYWYTNSYDLIHEYEYKIVEDSFLFKFTKFNDKYFLESSNRKMSCIQTKGNHINSLFSFEFNNEETLNHSNLNYKNFDFINNKFKK